MRQVLTMVHKVQSHWSCYVSVVFLLCLLTSLTTLQSWTLPYCSLHIPVYLMAFLFIVSSNSVNVSQITSLSGRFFSLATGYKMSPPPIPSWTKFSLSFVHICIHEIYNLIYEVYYFIYSFWCLPSFSQVHKLWEVKISACFSHSLIPIAQKKYLTPSNSFIIIY